MTQLQIQWMGKSTSLRGCNLFITVPEIKAYISISLSWLQLPLLFVRMCIMDMLGPHKVLFSSMIVHDLLGWLRKCVSTYFLYSDYIHYVYCGGLFERHYVDGEYTDTVIWIYIFVVSGSKIYYHPSFFCLFFSKSFHYKLSICSFSCLWRDPRCRCPKRQDT